MDGRAPGLVELPPPPRPPPVNSRIEPHAPASHHIHGSSPAPLVLGQSELASVLRVASRARLWGVLCATIGAVQVLASVYARNTPGMISYLPAGAIAILMGVASLSVGRTLYAVGRPGGDGLQKLLVAVDTMGLAFLIQIVTTVVGVLFAAVAVGLTMFSSALGIR